MPMSMTNLHKLAKYAFAGSTSLVLEKKPSPEAEEKYRQHQAQELQARIEKYQKDAPIITAAQLRRNRRLEKQKAIQAKLNNK